MVEQKKLQKYFGQLGPTLGIVGGICVILLVMLLLGAF